MIIQNQITQTLSEALEPAHLDVINESGMHNVPKGSETHFKVVAVSEQFGGKTLVNRHRMINDLLADELSGPVHALAIHAYTAANWESRFGQAPMSPPCLGGSKAD